MAGKIEIATQNAVQNAGRKGLQEYLKLYKKQFEAALPKMISPERFTRMAMTALTTNAKLRESTPESFIGACLLSAQLGLEPNTPLGQAYLIPYRNNKKGGVTECQFQIGYKGLLDLAYRSGLFRNITAQVVYENDEFIYSYGLEPVLRHVPAQNDRGEPRYVYAVYNLNNGGFAYEVMSISDIKQFAKAKSRSYNEGPWQTDFEAMAKKTVLKRLLKYAPLKTEVADGVGYDSMKIEADLSAPVDNELPIKVDFVVDEDTGEVTEVGSEAETGDE